MEIKITIYTNDARAYEDMKGVWHTRMDWKFKAHVQTRTSPLEQKALAMVHASVRGQIQCP